MPVMRAVAEKAAKGVTVIGVCNGFQILVEAGLLPGALMRNASLKFVCRRGQARGRQRQHHVHPRLRSRARSSARRWRIMTAITSPTPRRLPASKAKARWCSAMPKAPIPTARSTTLPASSTNKGNVLGLMPHPENLIEAAHGGIDGRALFESALGIAA